MFVMHVLRLVTLEFDLSWPPGLVEPRFELFSVVPTPYAADVDDLATQFLHSDLEVDCPVCSYPVWVRYSEVVCEAAVLCRCCRTTIKLIDERGKATTAADVVEEAMQQAFKGLFS